MMISINDFLMGSAMLLAMIVIALLPFVIVFEVMKTKKKDDENVS